MSAQGNPISTRRGALDGIRAFAVLAVIGFHAGIPGLANGGAGVVVFFVLSGYLITTLLVTGPLDLRGLAMFSLRRLLRLYPALIVLLGFCAAYAVFVLGPGARGRLLSEVVASGIYVQDFRLSTRSSISDYGYLGHTWSLAVEEQFYLVWPVAVALMRRRGVSLKGAAALSGALTVLAAGWRTYLSHEGLANRVGLGADGNAEALLLGCTLALALLAWPAPAASVRWAFRPGALLSVPLLVVIVSGRAQLPLDLTRLATALLSAVIIAIAVLEPAARLSHVLAWRPLAYLGLLSYSLYLWHPVVFHVFKDHLALDSLRARALWAPLMLAVTFAVAAMSYHLVERPMNSIKDRLRATSAIGGAGRGRQQAPPGIGPVHPIPAQLGRESEHVGSERSV